MNLRSLHLQGFKSFADRTSLEFRDGITAIVGSNGCGKSNIADAIRSVLGEQRAGALRNAKMDEVIFQGALRRRPLNSAEVSLRFGNEDGRIDLPQSEIEVTRRLFREGGSEYSPNRNVCRLRDIQGLLRDTGPGANAYSVIDASMSEVLLGDRAEERRLLFAEAAGVGRYKDSRHAATRWLEGAEGDLARMGDPIGEVENKVRSLAKQRRRAQRIHLLSGGERTLTAPALLFAPYLVKPSPFCLVDEVDTPLEESNVERFIQLLSDFKSETQFIVITHNARTMEAADWLYGVTMEERGVHAGRRGGGEHRGASAARTGSVADPARRPLQANAAGVHWGSPVVANRTSGPSRHAVSDETRCLRRGCGARRKHDPRNGLRGRPDPR